MQYSPINKGESKMKTSIKKRAVRLICLMGMLVILVVFFPACAGPDISVKSSTGFTHEASVRVPFSPPDDSVASLRIDDEGIAVFIKHIEIHHGHVNPEKEYRLEIYKVDKNGIVETEELGPFEFYRTTREGNFIITPEDMDTVTYLDLGSLDSTTVEDRTLALILKAFPADCFSNKIVTHLVPLSSKLNVERWLEIYNTETRKGVLVDLREEYTSINTIDFDGGNILVKAVKSNREPPDLYVLGLDGTMKLKLNLSYCKDPYSDDAKLVPGGVIVAASDVIVVDTSNTASQIARASIVKRYSFDGTVEWSQSIPITGGPRLRVLSSQDDDVLALTIFNSNEETSFIGYFTAYEGKQVYAHTFQSDSSIWPLDTKGSFYIYPQWSLYPGISPPSGRIALYSYDSEVATVDFNDGIYYFAASPSGEYFAVVSDKTLSIFSSAE